LSAAPIATTPPLRHDAAGDAGVVVAGAGTVVDSEGFGVVVCVAVGVAVVVVGAAVVVAGAVVVGAAGAAVFVAVGEGVLVVVGEGLVVGAAPSLATVKPPRRPEVVPFDHVSTALMLWDPSASFVVSYGTAVPSSAVPAKSKGGSVSVRKGGVERDELSR
jgi:hypothetical protein